MSERRACILIGADRAMIRYQSCRPAEAPLRERLRVLAGERRRFGYRRLHVLLRREGLVRNRKKVARRGRPTMMVSDHGTEFTSNAMLAWTEEAKVG